jgi:HD-GYP domain-containing protein (c-di-GMP phosphodiesterase class II)
MSTDARARTLAEWEAIVHALRSLLNVVTSRGRYPAGHPAVARADAHAAESFQRVLATNAELVVALFDGEFIVSERPQPGLREQLPGLAEIMSAHDVECFVFQRGLTAPECAAFGEIFSRAAAPGLADETHDQARVRLVHVLIRFIDAKAGRTDGAGDELDSALPAVRAMLARVTRAFEAIAPIDVKEVRTVAEAIVARTARRAFVLEPRSYSPGVDDFASHAANVATMTAAMALAARLPTATSVDVTAAALLHDAGHLFLPRVIRGVPEPLLTDERAKKSFRYHPFLGARALLVAECPPLWVATALDHHRGVDGGGYPSLAGKTAPHELVRLVSLASFFDRKRTPANGPVDAPPALLREAWTLADRYFDRAVLALFVRALGGYPPGSLVALSDGRAAKVTRASPDHPLRPEVMVLSGASGGQRVDLRSFDAVEGRYALSIAGAPQLPDDAATEDEEPAPEAPELPTDLPPSIAPSPEIAVPPIPPARPFAPPPPGASSPPSTPPKTGRYSLLPEERSERQGPRSERGSIAPSGPRVVLGPTEIASLPLDPRAGYLLSFMDGSTSLEEIAEASGVAEDEVRRLVRELERLGVVVS